MGISSKDKSIEELAIDFTEEEKLLNAIAEDLEKNELGQFRVVVGKSNNGFSMHNEYPLSRWLVETRPGWCEDNSILEVYKEPNGKNEPLVYLRLGDSLRVNVALVVAKHLMGYNKPFKEYRDNKELVKRIESLF
jgi:hypothetical protein